MSIAHEYHKMLKKFRKKAKMTQEDIADKLNMTQSTVSKIESGKHVIDIQTFFEWVRVTGCEVQTAAMMFGVDVLNNALQLLQTIPAFIGGFILLWI